jgi:uncharacterized protein
MPEEYLKDAPPRVFDVHVHYGRRPDEASGFNSEFRARMLAYTCGRLNIHKVALLGRRGADNYQTTLDAWKMFSDLIIPMAHIEPDVETADDVERLKERGFVGLKITRPERDYDDEKYYPLYERAESLSMPILFHTGISGGPIDYLLFPPRDHEVAERVSSVGEERMRGTRRSAARMQPIFLDTVAVAFPRLRIIGAHLGYGLYDSAAAVARWRRNVSFDISGGAVVRRHILDRRMIYHEVPPEKLVWGSDCDVAHMSRELTSWMEAFNRMGMSADDQDKIFYRNAARIFGVD